MSEHVIIKKNSYYDSVELMRISGRIRKHDGVVDSQLIMGSDANKQFLVDMGLSSSDFAAASASDLIIYLKLEKTDIKDVILEEIEKVLSEKKEDIGGEYTPRSIEGAMKIYPDINFVLLSIPGENVSWECRTALNLDKNVMIFSDNVPLKDEIELKKLARDNGLLVMGPDCGTAIINGIPLGFANKVRRGNIGLISASGTGLQAVTSEIHNLGGGISQAIGTGGHDLSEEVGGITMKTSIHALLQDPATEVIVLISKPPAESVTNEILDILKTSPKPVALYFIGSKIKSPGSDKIYLCSNLSHTARVAVKLSKNQTLTPDQAGYSPGTDLQNLTNLDKSGFTRGLYTGGTLAQEAAQTLESGGLNINSNITDDSDRFLDNPLESRGHTVIDLGEDFFTRGKPHPMISSESRKARLKQELHDPETGVILLDIVLGYGSHQDMAGALLPELRDNPRDIPILAYILGTDLDFQNKEDQEQKLREIGVKIFDSHITMIETVLKNYSGD